MQELLLAYLGRRVKKLDDLIFPSDAQKAKYITAKFQGLFRYHMKKLDDLNDARDDIPTRHKISLYSFKDFGFSRVQKVCDAEFARELKGDRTTEYSNYSIEEKMEMYIECEPELTLYNFENVRKELETKYSSQAKEIEELRTKLEENHWRTSEIVTLTANLMFLQKIKSKKENMKILNDLASGKISFQDVNEMVRECYEPSQ